MILSKFPVVNRTMTEPAKTLITPALFSQPPPRRPGEEGVVCRNAQPKSTRCQLHHPSP